VVDKVYQQLLEYLAIDKVYPQLLEYLAIAIIIIPP
jgi:hypothetical protein